MNNIKAKVHFTSSSLVKFISQGKIYGVHPSGAEMLLQFNNWLLQQETSEAEVVTGVLELHDLDWNQFILDNPEIDYRLISPRSLSLSFFHSLGIRAMGSNNRKKTLEIEKIEFVDEFNKPFVTMMVKDAVKIA